MDSGRNERSHTLPLEPASSGVLLCAGCVRLDRCQLGVVSEGVDAGILRFELICPREREGVAGIAHGGWVADVFDECLGKRILLEGQYAVTARLDVSFDRPVPVGEELTLSTWVVAAHDTARWAVEGELRRSSDKTVLATAAAEFVSRDQDRHVQRFRTWRDAG